MSADDQSAVYLTEAGLTLSSARAIFETASAQQEPLWAAVVKNGYDAMEQAVSAAIAAQEERIPRAHPAKIQTFVNLHQPPDRVESVLLYWLERRSTSQYVDIRGDEITVPHTQFDRNDADRILDDVRTVIDYVEERTSPKE